jgi:hypothetical protein
MWTAKKCALIALSIIGIATAHAAELPTSAAVPACEDARAALELDFNTKQSDYFFKAAQLRLAVFQDQRVLNYAILFSVTVIVLAGAAFAIQMLRSSVMLGKGQPVSDLELSLQKVRLTSFQTASLTGLLLFGMTLVFFYLYMQTVMTIHEVAASNTPAGSGVLAPREIGQPIPAPPR